MVTSSGPPGVAASRASIPAAGASKQGLEYKQHIQLGRVNGSFREQGGLYLVTQCSSLPGKHTTHAGGSISPPPLYMSVAQKRQELRLSQFASETTAGKHTADW